MRQITKKEGSNDNGKIIIARVVDRRLVYTLNADLEITARHPGC